MYVKLLTWILCLCEKLFWCGSCCCIVWKMDRASILGDAIEYLKELLQKINDLHNELESNPPGSSLTPTTTSFYPLTPTPPSLPCRIKEELCPSSLPSPNGQPARVHLCFPASKFRLLLLQRQLLYFLKHFLGEVLHVRYLRSFSVFG